MIINHNRLSDRTGTRVSVKQWSKVNARPQACGSAAQLAVHLIGALGVCGPGDAGRQLRQRGGLSLRPAGQHGVEMVVAIPSEQQQLELSWLPSG